MSIHKTCLITPGHIASNPRLVKEATALTKAGHEIHLIFVQTLESLVKHDMDILAEHPTWSYSILNTTRKSLFIKFTRLFKSLIAKAITFSLRYKLTLFSCKLITNRNYYWQLNEAKKNKANLYIAHNLGALAVVYHAAKKNSSKYGFDAEDFHRYEITNNRCATAYKVAKYLEDYYLISANYLTAASPLIAQAYKKEYPQLNPVVINNVFPKVHFKLVKKPNHNGIRLFWFSQTVGKGRGLEDVIQALGYLGDESITLTLLGNVSETDKQYFTQIADKSQFNKNCLTFMPTVAGNEIFKIAAQFDVGLALEKTDPLNRDICLTNKIFTYLSAGIAIIATDTSAQKQFIETYPVVGRIYPNGDLNALIAEIIFFNANRDKLNEAKIAAYTLAVQKLNWENESAVFLKTISQIN